MGLGFALGFHAATASTHALLLLLHEYDRRDDAASGCALLWIISVLGERTESARAVSTVKLGLADDDSVFYYSIPVPK